MRPTTLLIVVALSGATSTNSLSVDSPQSRLRDLVDSIKTTHGGPAYISSEELEAALERAESALEEKAQLYSSEEEAYSSACGVLMSALRDPLASHLRPEQAVAARERFHGRASLGLSLCMCLVPEQKAAPDDDAKPPMFQWPRWPWSRQGDWRRAALVSEVRVGSPAERAGIKEGDEVLEVDNEALAGRSERSALNLLDHGPEGSAVRLKLRRGRRGAVQMSGAVPARIQPELDDGVSSRQRRPVWRELRRVATPTPTVCSRPIANGKAHMFVISSFGSTTAAELRDALRRIPQRGGGGGGKEEEEEAEGASTPWPSTLVFDLRGNEGGLLPEAIDACRMICPKGRHLVSLSKESPHLKVSKAYRTRWYHKCELPKPLAKAAAAARSRLSSSAADKPTDPGSTTTRTSPLVVLLNHGSASSAEVFAGALAHAAGALVVGTRSYGKGSSQAVVYQRDGYAASFTAYTLRVGRRRGSTRLEGVGVEPHVKWRWRAPRLNQAVADAEVERALAACSQLN